MLCAYNGATFISKAKDGKNKTDFITGILFLYCNIVKHACLYLKVVSKLVS